MTFNIRTAQLAVPVGPQDHSVGPETAAVTLVEYSDYECPYCGAAEPAIQGVRRVIEGTLRFVFRNFPLLEAHPHALEAAAAAEAAGLQGKFWLMHDLLFQNQQALDEASLLVYGARIGLAIDRFGADMQSVPVLQRIQRDIDGGVRSGVEGTPTFFVNNLKYEGSWNYESLLEALEDAARTS